MWGKKDVLETLTSQGHFFNADKPHYRLNPAGPLHAEIAALTGIGEYYDTLYENHFDETDLNRHERTIKIFNLFADHESRLADQLLETLRALSEVKIIGQQHAIPGKRAATISFVPNNKKPSHIVKQLAKRKIAVRNGHFYAFRCVEALGIADPEEGVVRISLVHYNTEDEVNRLSEALRSVLF
jgi:selenocysteine lyase/cysteine desulfurase